MRLVIQRVKSAHVSVNDKILSSITQGLLVLTGIHSDDNDAIFNQAKEKLLHLRIFADSEDKTNLSIKQIQGEILAVSQFTLYADISKGRRPSFTKAAPYEIAKKLFDRWIELLRGDISVKTGEFGAKMQVHLVNDGPVTIVMEFS